MSRTANRGEVSKATQDKRAVRKSCRLATVNRYGLVSRSKLVSDSLRGEVALIGDPAFRIVLRKEPSAMAVYVAFERRYYSVDSRGFREVLIVAKSSLRERQVAGRGVRFPVPLH